MSTIREQFERTSCGCAGCRVGCKTMPATLAVGDALAIAEHLGQEYGREFLTSNFRLSLGTKVGSIRNGQLAVEVVPTITPAQRENGHCVFLSADEQCTVHPVSPFGCAFFDSHQTAEQGNIAAKAMIGGIVADRHERGQYFQECSWLAAAGKVSPDLDSRRAAFERELDKAIDAGQVPNPQRPSMESGQCSPST